MERPRPRSTGARFDLGTVRGSRRSVRSSVSAVLTLGLLLAGSLGCRHHIDVIRVSDPPGATAIPENDRKTVARTVADTAAEFGLDLHPARAFHARGLEACDRCPYLLIEEYTLPSGSARDLGTELSLYVSREGRELLVHVLRPSGRHRTELEQQLRDRLVERLRAALPGYTVTTERADDRGLSPLSLIRDPELVKRAETGDTRAQFAVAEAYATGKGRLRNDAEAAKWMRRSAEGGYARAQYEFGYMYDRGSGVPENDAEALRWFRKAAEQGYAIAEYAVAASYANGEGVAQSDVEAAKWCRKAAEQGLGSAQYNLGNLYEQGKGVSQNSVLAHMWWSLAHANGMKAAQGHIDTLEGKMTQEQIVEAQRLRKEWIRR